MNIRQAKQLRKHDTFRRPSTNQHDRGYRVYTVALAYPEGFTAIDQHGYHIRVHWTDCSSRPFLKTVERCEPLVTGPHVVFTVTPGALAVVALRSSE